MTTSAAETVSSNKDRSWLSGCAGYFLAKANGDGNTPALDGELATDGEALVEALRLRVTHYVIQEFRHSDFAGKKAATEKRSCSRQTADIAPKRMVELLVETN
jgi:hypothetical protein